MTEKVDYTSLRLLPLSILIMLLAMPIEALIEYFVMVTFNSEKHNFPDVQNVIDIILSNGLFFSYIALVAVVVCLYRLYNISKWFHYSWILFGMKPVSELLIHIIRLFCSMTGSGLAVRLIVDIISQLTEILILVGVIFLINGFIELYERMNHKSEKDPCITIKRVWTVMEIVRIIVIILYYIVSYIINYVGDVSVGLMAVFTVLTVLPYLLYVYYAALGILIFLRTRHLCRESYMYYYNLI